MSLRAADRTPDVLGVLTAALPPGCVNTDATARRLHSADLYSEGALCAAVVTPRSVADVSATLTAASAAGIGVVPRGGGMSYTNGYVRPEPDFIVLDLGALSTIRCVDTARGYVTVDAGVTWAQLYDTLTPLGYRLPFFGTFSGLRATIGGGISQGALFFGSARYGQAADTVLALEVALADGRVLHIGQDSFRNGKPFYRGFGPDLVGLFVHDNGSFGVKTGATLKIIPTPPVTRCASFRFDDFESSAQALSAIGRGGYAEEAYVLDAEALARNLTQATARAGLQAALGVARRASNPVAGIVQAARFLWGGARSQRPGHSLHVVCSGRSANAAGDDLRACTAEARRFGAMPIPSTIPTAVRAQPFRPLDGVIGTEGDRFVSLNAKVAHADALAIVRAGDAILAEYAERMRARQITVSRVLSAVGEHAISYEPVLHWPDRWLPLHRAVPSPTYLAAIKEPTVPAGTSELVAELKARFIQMFADHGAASNQIGRTYPYLDSLHPDVRQLVMDIKRVVDPSGVLNAGVLGIS